MSISKRISMSVFVLIAGLLTGCTTVPTQQFSSYREVFDKARVIGEQVLIDYGVARSETEALQKAVAEAEETAANMSNTGRELVFDVGSARDKEVSIDHIAVRMQAWDIVGRYNEALTGLAEGKSAAEVAGLVEGLYTNLSTFPFEAIAEVAADAAPFVGALEMLLTKAQEEWSRREFIRVVKSGGPMIRQVFLKSLADDAQNFYNERAVLNDLRYQEKLDELAEVVTHFHTLVNQYKEDDNGRLTTIIHDVNETLRQVPDYLSGDEDVDEERWVSWMGAGLADYDNLAHSNLVQVKQQIHKIIGEAALINEELNAYKTTIVAYVKLLDQLATSLRGLEKAASERKAMPPINDLLTVYVELRQAHETYKSTR